MNAARFIRLLLGTFIVLVVFVYGLILAVDPYQNVPFSLPLDRAPISTNQRFSYPALARQADFDSAIIGSSTLRLLNPENLDSLTGARFVNLAMNSATAYEQMKILDLFMRQHPQAKYVIIGIDDSWCKREASYEKYTFRAFPEWMYDENRWNDLLYLFNDKALENTVRMIEYVAGHRKAKYEKNGFRDFTADFGEYDLQRVRKRLYPDGTGTQSRTSNPAEPNLDDLRSAISALDLTPSTQHPTWEFAAHLILEAMLGIVENARQPLLVFVPFHRHYLERGAALYRECKGRIMAIAENRQVPVVDFMVDSEITRNDENYWDPLHFRTSVARQLEAEIATELKIHVGRLICHIGH